MIQADKDHGNSQLRRLSTYTTKDNDTNNSLIEIQSYNTFGNVALNDNVHVGLNVTMPSEV